MKFQYLCLNNQMDISDCSELAEFRYDAPETFDQGLMADAEAFLKAEGEFYGYDETPSIKYWDGRTMVVEFSDSLGTSVQTYVFEECAA